MRRALLKTILTAGLAVAVLPALATQQTAPLPIWCNTPNVPGLYSSAQEVCDARRKATNWQWPLQYFPEPTAPSYGPYGYCEYWRDSLSSWQNFGYATWGLVCPFPYQPVNAITNVYGNCSFTSSSAYPQVRVSPGNNAYCENTGVDPFKNKGPCCDISVGHPINVGVQNKHLTEIDIRAVGVAAPLTLTRTYNSAAVPEDGSPTAVPVPLLIGRHWSATYDTQVFLSAFGALQTAWVTRPDGRVFYFNLTGTQWLPDADISDRLARTVDGSNNPIGWQYYVAATEETETYNVSGRLVAVTSRSGAMQTLTYNAQSQLSTVQDAFGRQFTFGFGANGLLQSLTDPAGRITGYQYDAYGNLIEVDNPDATARHYLYENTTFKSALTGVTDENGVRYATYAYDTSGNATSTQLAGGVDKWSVTPSGQITDPLGNVTTRTFSTILGVVKTASSTAPCSACGSGGSGQSFTYDTNGNLSSRTDFNSKKVCYAYDLTRNLETARAEGILSTETCSTVLATLPNRADVRKVSTQWHLIWRLPTIVAEPNRLTTNVYNGDGGVYCAPTNAVVAGNPIGVLCKKTVQETTDATGQQGFGATVTGTARVWQYTYDAYGQVLTATDPNGKVATTVYYAATDPDLGKRGNVQTITNPLGHVTTFTAYDLNGRPTSLTDPNGTVATLAYHPRGWLVSRTVGGETTTYTYDGVGQLAKVTQPDGSFIQYTYDGAHRLTQIQDGLGNKIVYTLDAMGNRVKEQAYDPSGALARVRQQVYDSLNRLHQTVGAQ